MTQTNNEREAFEAWYAKMYPKVDSLTHKNEMLGCWQARAKLPISQNEQQEAIEALHERDRLGFAVAEVIGKLDEVIEVAEDIEFDDFAHIAIPLELWNELKDALELMPERADNYTSPPKQAIPEDVIKDAQRYNWLKQNYHGFEMFRHSTIPYVTLDREVDNAMLNAAPTNTEVGE